MHVGATLCGRPRLAAIAYFKMITSHTGEATEGLPYMLPFDFATALHARRAFLSNGLPLILGEATEPYADEQSKFTIESLRRAAPPSLAARRAYRRVQRVCSLSFNRRCGDAT